MFRVRAEVGLSEDSVVTESTWIIGETVQYSSFSSDQLADRSPDLCILHMKEHVASSNQDYHLVHLLTQLVVLADIFCTLHFSHESAPDVLIIV